MKKKIYKVMKGDPFGGYITVRQGLTKEDADKLKAKLEKDCDYFTVVDIEEYYN